MFWALGIETHHQNVRKEPFRRQAKARKILKSSNSSYLEMLSLECLNQRKKADSNNFSEI